MEQKHFFELALKKCGNGFKTAELPLHCWWKDKRENEPCGKWFIASDYGNCAPQTLCFCKDINTKRAYIEFTPFPEISEGVEYPKPPQDGVPLFFFITLPDEEEGTKVEELPEDLCLEALNTLPCKPQAKFAVWEDTVEVHPYILNYPLERNPVVAAIENISEAPITVDMWAVFGNVKLPVQTTPTIKSSSTLDYVYEFTTPNVPPGSYPCTFYIGKYGKYIDDKFTQPVIRVSKTIIEASLNYSAVLAPKVAIRGQKTQLEFPITVKGIFGAGSISADIWTIKDTYEFYKAIPEGVTIVDDIVLQLMEKFTTGITKTEPLTTGVSLHHIHEFTVPEDLPLGRHTFQTFFGEWGNYFHLGGIYSGYKFDMVVIDVLSEPKGASVYIIKKT